MWEKCRNFPFVLLLHLAYMQKLQFSVAIYAKHGTFFSSMFHIFPVKKANKQKRQIQTGAGPLYIYTCVNILSGFCFRICFYAKYRNNILSFWTDTATSCRVLVWRNFPAKAAVWLRSCYHICQSFWHSWQQYYIIWSKHYF